MKPDKELEKILQSRTIPPMRGTLTARIIGAADNMEQQGIPAFDAWRHVFREALILPRPAFALGLVLLLGLVLGYGGDLYFPAEAQDQVSDYLFMAEHVLDEGEWL